MRSHPAVDICTAPAALDLPAGHEAAEICVIHLCRQHGCQVRVELIVAAAPKGGQGDRGRGRGRGPAGRGRGGVGDELTVQLLPARMQGKGRAAAHIMRHSSAHQTIWNGDAKGPTFFVYVYAR